jgi:hypothetical protein
VYDVEQRQKQQDIEKHIWEEQENKKREEAEKINDEYEPEEKDWEEIKEKPYHAEVIDFAVCLDTMGQDRQFTEEETNIALDAVARFAKNWQEQEARNLSKDINRRVEKAQEDQIFYDRAKTKFEDIAEKWVEQNSEENDDPKGAEEQARLDEIKMLRLTFRKKVLNAEKIEVRPESPPDTK